MQNLSKVVNFGQIVVILAKIPDSNDVYKTLKVLAKSQHYV
jgi:hypothetical protein